MRLGTLLSIAIFVLVACKPIVKPVPPPLTIDTAPWKTEGSEICARNPKTGLRAHIFPPNYVTHMGSTRAHVDSTELVFIPGRRLADGSTTRTRVRERLIPNMYHPKSFRHLKQQTVGYLNDKNEWVNEYGNPVFALENFYTMQGNPSPPIETVLTTTELETNLLTTQDDYLNIKARIQNAPPCTYIQIPTTFKTLKETVEYTSPNQALTCGAAGNIEKKPPFVYTRDITRRVPVKEGTILFTDIFGNYGEGMQAAFKADKISYQGQFCGWVHLSQRP